MIRRIKYLRRLLSKLSSFAVFGIGSIFLASALFPVFHLVSGFSERRFNVISRRFVSFFFLNMVQHNLIQIRERTANNKQDITRINNIRT